MFIQLTEWIPDSTLPERRRGNPVYINVDQIVRFNPACAVWHAQHPVPQGEPAQINAREKEVTCIVFPAGMHEDIDAIFVVETVEEIMNKIGICF